jgi:hypothetical protein
LIRQIEEARDSRLLVYVTGDRGPAGANIGDDAVRPIIEHLRQIGKVEQLDLFLYSRGGAIDVPWRLNNSFRRASDSWSALVPFRAHSAATLLSLGADQIVMGPQAELGPIDPIMTFSQASPTGPQQDAISVEDIMAFARFAVERFGLEEEASRATSLSKLTDRLDAVALGNAYRTHSHIRYLARKMLTSRNADSNSNEKADIDTIVATLAEHVYAHGHAIGFQEAQEIGLPVTAADAELDALMWQLLQEYETDLRLLEPLDPFDLVQESDRHTEPVTLAVIETAEGSHEFQARLDIQAQRQLPPSLEVQLNVPI